MKTSHIVLVISLVIGLSVYLFSQDTEKAEITIAEFIELIKSETKPIILDVRNPDELKGKLGHIDGVINIPVHELEARMGELNKYKDKKIAVICRSGNRSKYGTAILNKNGFNAVNVKGGMRKLRSNSKFM